VLAAAPTVSMSDVAINKRSQYQFLIARHKTGKPTRGLSTSAGFKNHSLWVPPHRI
jgi:hypothetical protein